MKIARRRRRPDGRRHRTGCRAKRARGAAQRRATSSIERGMATASRRIWIASVEKGRMTRRSARRRARAHRSAPHSHDLDVDLAIEAATEHLDTKLDLFRTLDEHAPRRRRSSPATRRRSRSRCWAPRRSGRERVIGMHFMNPVPVMQLVEIIRGIATSQETYRVHARPAPCRWARRRSKCAISRASSRTAS